MRAVKQVKIRWEGEKSVVENAAGKLPELALGFFAVGRALEASEPSLEDLHRFRLQTKRFRYTLEQFRHCYGPGLARRIDALRTLQQCLGEISDLATTSDLLDGRAGLSKPLRLRLERHMRALAAARVAGFGRHWKEEFPPGRERWWTDYLRRFAGRQKYNFSGN